MRIQGHVLMIEGQTPSNDTFVSVQMREMKNDDRTFFGSSGLCEPRNEHGPWSDDILWSDGMSQHNTS